jgi:hypothetical protein
MPLEEATWTKGEGVDRRRLLGLSVYAVVTATTGACSALRESQETPGLEPRGTTLTTVKPTRQDISNRLSLAGKVTLNPVYGVVAPVAGQVRYANVAQAQGTPTKPTKVGTVVASGKSHTVEVPAGSVFMGRLADDRSTVIAGVPIASAKYVGYGIVADVDGAQAYKISDSLSSIQAQIQGGPGPFTCTALGTVTALPPGTLPPPPVTGTPPDPGTGQQGGPNGTASEATGLRLVCVAPAGVKMINGASATLEVVTEKASNVLVLPVEAVAGSQGTGRVDIVKPDGQKETREVVLGLTDGKVIEIKSGLTGEENIAVPAPNLPKPKQDEGRFPGKGDLHLPQPVISK